ncbi:PPPDE putative peptidase domain-containing protein [Mycena floridula]|nr:PPPDE putative peptidase domain-containing protein [Mycena floridula]
MPEPVKLYVYDLSNGLAKQLSRQLTGRQIDGIWHTSIVVFGKETFYGQGIDITAPGRSHHGAPLQIVDLGETSIDEETWWEYIDEMRTSFTADKYHLLDFNCNSFTNDCAGFLTGGSIPDFIKDLPTDFLSTPFGAALRPTIDNMYRRPSPGTAPAVPQPVSTPNPDLTASILQAVASQAASRGSGPPPLPATESLTGAIHPCTNRAAFDNVIKTHRAVVVNFSNLATCAPCRMIAPIYEQLASEKGIRIGTSSGRTGAVFMKVDMATPGGSSLSSELSVSVMPTFWFFLDGKKIDEMKGANPSELRSQIDLLLFQAYPPHPHTSLSLPALEAVSLKPILFVTVPALDTVSTKLAGFIDNAPWPVKSSYTKAQVKQSLSATVIPYLKARFAAKEKSVLPSATPSILAAWSQITAVLAEALPVESLFPIVDIWRLGFLDPAVSSWSAANIIAPGDPITIFLAEVNVQDSPRNYILTVLRLLSNAFSSQPLAERLLASGKSSMTALLIPALLHTDTTVRTAAASLAFNVAGFVQQGRVEKVRNGGGTGMTDEDNDWDVEMASAIVEAIEREKENEEVVHRLAASLGCLIRLSPCHEEVTPLLEVLQARKVLQSKLGKGGCGENGVTKKDARKLIDEIATKLCP